MNNTKKNKNISINTNRNNLTIKRKIVSHKKINNKQTYKFKYYNNNKEIKSKKIIDRITKFRIPPAYKEVKISSDENSHIQATGLDDKNRKQYVYHPKYISNKQEQKYDNIIKLGNNIPKITKKMMSIINKNVNKRINLQNETNNRKTKEIFITIIIYLLAHCNFRIGNIKYVNLYNSYGATTLKKKHLKFKDKYTYIEFIGKKGVLNTAIIDDKKVTNILKELVKKKSQNDFIFSFTNNKNPISNELVTEYLRSFHEDITPKMFRTWYANNYLLEKLLKDIKKNDSNLIKLCYTRKNNKYIKNCCEYVAERLHNSANISKKSYLDTEIMNELINKPCEFINFLKENKNNKTDVILIKLFNKLR